MSGLCYSYVAVKLTKPTRLLLLSLFFLLRIKHAISPKCLLPSGSSHSNRMNISMEYEGLMLSDTISFDTLFPSHSGENHRS